MRYEICINQKGLLALGITNLSQGIIFDLVYHARYWAEPISINNVRFFWLARQVIVAELPLLNLKSDTVYRHLKSLAQSGLIEYQKSGKKDCVRVTEKGEIYDSFPMSETNPSFYVGKKSEQNSEKNPTDHYYNINPDIYAREHDFVEFFSTYPRKQNPHQARQAYQHIISLGMCHKKLMRALQSELANWQHRDIKFIPYAENWLKSENWHTAQTNPVNSHQMPITKIGKQQMRQQLTDAVLDIENTDW